MPRQTLMGVPLIVFYAGQRAEQNPPCFGIKCLHRSGIAWIRVNMFACFSNRSLGLFSLLHPAANLRPRQFSTNLNLNEFRMRKSCSKDQMALRRIYFGWYSDVVTFSKTSEGYYFCLLVLRLLGCGL